MCAELQFVYYRCCLFVLYFYNFDMYSEMFIYFKYYYYIEPTCFLFHFNWFFFCDNLFMLVKHIKPSMWNVNELLKINSLHVCLDLIIFLVWHVNTYWIDPNANMNCMEIWVWKCFWNLTILVWETYSNFLFKIQIIAFPNYNKLQLTQTMYIRWTKWCVHEAVEHWKE